MKKIFYFIASAIVALGAVACQNDINENIAPESEGLSFIADLEEVTRMTVADSDDTAKGNKMLVWEGTETIEVVYSDDKTFSFTNTTDAPNTFSCSEPGVNALADGNSYALNFNQEGDHATGSAKTFKLGGYITFDESTPSAKISLTGGSIIFHFTCEEEITLEWSGYYLDFSSTSKTFAAGEHYIAVYGGGEEHTLKASIGSEVIKQKTLTLDEGKIYNLGKIAKPAKLYVINNANWTPLQVYAWDANGKEILGSWPGTAMTQVDNTNKFYVEIDGKYVGQTINYIVNNKVGDAGNQTADLVAENFADGYTYEMPAAYDPKPETVTVYLKTTWGWSDWSLWAWDSTGEWYTEWPGQAVEYTVEIGGISYKAWDVPTGHVGKSGTGIIIVGNEWSEQKQTTDTTISDSSKDIFVELNTWNSTEGKGELTILASPY